MTNPFYSAGLGITGRWLGPNMARHHAACQSNNMVGVSIKQMFRNVFIIRQYVQYIRPPCTLINTILLVFFVHFPLFVPLLLCHNLLCGFSVVFRSKNKMFGHLVRLRAAHCSKCWLCMQFNFLVSDLTQYLIVRHSIWLCGDYWAQSDDTPLRGQKGHNCLWCGAHTIFICILNHTF